MAAKLNLPGGQSERQEETEQTTETEQQNQIEEPEPEVPEDEMSSIDVVHLESKLEPVILGKEETESTEKELDPKTIGAEVAALLDAVNAETKVEKEIGPEIVLRKKTKEDDDIGRRGSTFLTEIEDNEDVGPEVAKIANKIVSENISDIESDDHRLTSSDAVDKRVEVIEPLFVEKIVQPLGIVDIPSTNDEVDSKKETVNESPVDTIGEIKDHITGSMTEPINEEKKIKEVLSTKEEDKSTDEKSVSESFSDKNTIELSTKQDLPIKSEVETIGSIDEDNSSEDLQEHKTLIDITVIEETANENDIKSESISASENEVKGEIDEALKEIPEMSSSISAQDLLRASLTAEEVSKEVAEEIQITSEDRQDGALIDITVIEETDNKDKSVQEVVKEAKELFTAEVIPDNADIEVIGDEGESVVELTMEAKDAIPLGAIAVAVFAIFLALLFYWN